MVNKFDRLKMMLLQTRHVVSPPPQQVHGTKSNMEVLVATWRRPVVTCPTSVGGAENARRENAGHENDGPSSRA